MRWMPSPAGRQNFDVAWQLEQRPHPGVAVGSFPNGYLTGIKFTARLDMPPPPRIDKSIADAVTKYDIVKRAIDGELTLREVEASAGVNGRLATWTLAMGQGRTTRSLSDWVWEINPGRKFLIVSEEDGRADRPYVR